MEEIRTQNGVIWSDRWRLGALTRDELMNIGYVSVIIGLEAYRPFFSNHRVPCVVAGFEPVMTAFAGRIRDEEIDAILDTGVDESHPALFDALLDGVAVRVHRRAPPQPLATNGEPFARGGHDPQVGAGAQQRVDGLGNLVDQMLAVVDDEQDAPVAEEVDHDWLAPRVADDVAVVAVGDDDDVW